MGGHTRSAEDEEALMREWASFADEDKMSVEWEGNLPLNQDEVDSLLGFDIRKKYQEGPSMEEVLASIRRIMTNAAENPEPLNAKPEFRLSDPPEKSLRDRLIDMRTNKKLRSEGMPFWSFLSDLAMGMTAIRDSWPKNWKRTGLWMNDENRLILNGEEWVPTQDDILADDWQIGD